MKSAAAKPAATSPSSECSSATTFRSGRPMRAVAASLSPWIGGAPGSIAFCGVKTASSTSYSTLSARTPASAAATVSATTAATRWPMNRTTSSSTRVSSGSSV